MSRKERENAPVIEVSSRQLDFGECKQAVTKSITITNNGKSKMQIRKIMNDMPNVFVTKLSNTSVRSGASITLEVTFVPSECKMSSINHHFTIICNDPANSRVIVNMNADK